MTGSIEYPPQFTSRNDRAIPDQRLELPIGRKEVPLTIVGCHGAFQDGSVWDEFTLAVEAKGQGHTVIAPTLHAEDTSSTFDIDARLVVDALRGYKNLFLIGQSRGGEMIPRVLDQLDEAGELDRVVGAVFLNSGGPHAFALQPPYNNPEESLPRYSEAFLDGIDERGEDGLTWLNPSVAREVLHNGVENEIAIRAVKRLRLQRKPDSHPSPLPPLPKSIRIFWLLGKEDMLLNNQRSAIVAEQWAGVTATEVPGFNHTPQILMPAYLADMMIDLGQASLLSRAET